MIGRMRTFEFGMRPLSFVVLALATACGNDPAPKTEAIVVGTAGAGPVAGSPGAGAAGINGTPVPGVGGSAGAAPVASAGAGSVPASGIIVSVSPRIVTVPPGGTQAFTCTVSGSDTGACTWKVTEAGGGTVDNTGKYSASGSAGVYHVVASSVADPTSSGAAAVAVNTNTPTACPTDGSAVGTWENIMPAAFVSDYTGVQVVVVNPKDGSVFAAASNVTDTPQGYKGYVGGTGVYKSTDCGATWNSIGKGDGAASLKTGVIWSMQIDPENPDVLYAANGYGNNPTLFRSTDGGVTWKGLAPDVDNVLPMHNNFVQAVALDPSNSKHIAVTFHDSCTGKYSPNCMSASVDGGDTWTEFNGPAKVGGWGEAASLAILGKTSYFYTGGNSGYGGEWFTADNGATWKEVMSGDLGGSYANGAHFAPDGALYVCNSQVQQQNTNSGISVSRATKDSPVGLTWTPLPGSKPCSVISDDGQRLFAAYSWDTSGSPFWSAPLSDLTKWTNYKTALVVSNKSMYPFEGPNQFSYDSMHHLLYATDGGAGLWRLHTEK
jgi:hypothetical protein